ncbi:hypothetical protein ABAC460_01285 [Asticcacaulis sp. AC460]|uniref:RNA polymerase sigma factor n=1 Tax=Asticcacaulis sp. AC460 TaxID=1282360 RepID=UPI0003C3D3EB|nr:RNA polymerase sigma factor [Asticcacaulis sp. AC460]ESQ92908.1 hypothetical protein ABAC460_01285 [Asticcacaulis sp. AC460]
MTQGEVGKRLDVIYRQEARRVRAILIRLLGSFDAAEEALHDAFTAAAAQWPRDGIPANPSAWLVSTGRFRTLDRWRRQARFEKIMPYLAMMAEPMPDTFPAEAIADDELRLIFICCHPLLPPDARAALTLREIGGLTTEEIARAYLVSAATIAQRIVRAKARIRDAAIGYEVPGAADLQERLNSVLQVIYLVFNEGYATSHGPDLMRADLCAEAIRLARLIVDLTGDVEAMGLLALQLLHDSRRFTRLDGTGDIIRLEDQDRTLWDRDQITEAQSWIARALSRNHVGPYLVQAAIAELHARAPSLQETDWTQVVALYTTLERLEISPVVALNRAVAISMRDGPEVGLAAVEAVLAAGGLAEYPLAHAAHADLHRQLGNTSAAGDGYRSALRLTRQPAERRFLQMRLDQLVE